ncbi:hypothetical protein J4558_13765 [Leptolyngbya sp. 15MV]|nr:hypothetical protein J4558_13765 [Leptolyngbya sp. 15MV]
MRQFLLATAAVVGFAAAASAAPLTLTGNFVQVGVSDRGTLGSNGSTPPGMRHDPTGAGNFTPGGIANDYLTPGTPHEGFSINSTQTGYRENTNASSFNSFAFSAPTTTTVSGYSIAATQSGTLAGFLNVTHEPVVSSEALEQHRVFTSVLSVTYRVRR